MQLAFHSRTFRALPARLTGVTLLEILITIVILSLGLLGVAALQANSLKSNHDAYYYGQASALAYEIAERIRANPTALNSYAVAMGSGVPSSSNCAATTCTVAQMAGFDVSQWRLRLSDISLSEGATAISVGGGSTAAIVVRWKGLVGGNCNADGSANSSGAYKCFRLTVNPT